MKVIAVDNYGRESVSDVLIRDNLSIEDADALATLLNFKAGDEAPDKYYVVKNDDYELYEFNPR
jgi:hypothetical protein